MSRFPPQESERTENLALRSPAAHPQHQQSGTKHRIWGSNPMAASSVTPTRRVRQDARDSIAVMVFSGATSCVVALLLALVVRLGN